jgi:hypothetical protein
MTTGIAVAANIHVMRLSRQALREGRAVEAKFGLLPSIKIEARDVVTKETSPE